MRPIPEPNYQMLLNSAIASLQQTYDKYKKAIINNISLTWFTDNGEYSVYSGVEERNKEIADLQKEVTRLVFKVEELQGIVNGEEN